MESSPSYDSEGPPPIYHGYCCIVGCTTQPVRWRLTVITVSALRPLSARLSLSQGLMTRIRLGDLLALSFGCKLILIFTSILLPLDQYPLTYLQFFGNEHWHFLWPSTSIESFGSTFTGEGPHGRPQLQVIEFLVIVVDFESNSY